MRTILATLFALLRATLMPRASLLLENAALRQQLTVLQRARKRPRLRTADRLFWVLLSRFWSGWISRLVIVKPATVIGWHRRGFRLLWHRRSSRGKVGRPRIPLRHIEFIRRISSAHPEWGEDKIAEELAVKLGMHHSTSTIRRYMVRRRDPRRGQTWRTFIKNHADEIFACDFLVQYTALFDIVYVFVVMQIASRRVVHCNVTASPTLRWVKQQIRNLAPFDSGPRFLIHDNDGIFGQLGNRARRVGATSGRHFRCHLDRWLKEVMGIDGIPIPYGAPNANAHVGRFHRTLREDALNHFIFLSERHVRRVCAKFIAYYNGARPSQATHAIPAPYPELTKPPPPDGRLVALSVLGGVQHDYRLAA